MRDTKSSLRISSPTRPAEIAVTPSGDMLDQGYREFTAIGDYSMWTPANGKKFKLVSCAIKGWNDDNSHRLNAYLEYKTTTNNVTTWEKIDYLLFNKGPDNKQCDIILSDEQAITSEGIRLRITGTSTSFLIGCLVEGLEK